MINGIADYLVIESEFSVSRETCFRDSGDSRETLCPDGDVSRDTRMIG